MGFVSREALPGVFHIQDAMGVCMTLLVGSRRALLVDTGYGLEDVAAFARTLTPLPLTVLLTHAHHDHALGARWFDRVWLFPEDGDAFSLYTDETHRRRVLEQAREKGLQASSDMLSAQMPAPEALAEGDIELGDLTARVLRCPGHTPGSAVVLVPQRALLLTGDAWNPCTWLFFPEALPVRAYRRNARALLELPFAHVLCAHQPQLYPRQAMADALAGLTDEALCAAPRVTIAPYASIRTHQASLPGGCVLVFDRAKFTPDEEERNESDDHP